jgi:transposase
MDEPKRPRRTRRKPLARYPGLTPNELKRARADLRANRALLCNDCPSHSEPQSSLARHLAAEKQRLARKMGVSIETLNRMIRSLDEGWEQSADDPAFATFTWQSERGVGRPSKIALAQEAANLQRAGMNNPQIASELNKRHGEGMTTSEAVRKLLKRYPDKS